MRGKTWKCSLVEVLASFTQQLTGWCITNRQAVSSLQYKRSAIEKVAPSAER